MQFGQEHADAGQVAVAFGEIEAVADDKMVGNGEADEIRGDLGLAAMLFVEQDAGVKRGGFLTAKDAGDFGEGVAGVEDVVNKQDVLLGEVEADLVNDFRLGDGAVFVFVGGDADAVETHVEVELPQEVGGEHDGAVGDADDGDFVRSEALVERGDLAAEFDDAAADVFFSDENFCQIFMHG